MDEPQVWSIHESLTGEKVFESDDPKAVVREAERLEKAAKGEPPVRGVVGGSYRIEGDPVALGLVDAGD